MKVRIKFAKFGSMKFIGHLDIMRFFHKAFRRSELEMEYSKGFSPHQVVSFASPLGVGLTSEAEYVDIQVASCDSSEEMVKRLNEVMVEGITILSFRELNGECKNAMSIVAGADYLVSLKEGEHPFPEFKEKFIEFYSRNTISILKKTKKSEKEMDIKPFIYDVSVDKGENGVFLQLAAGSVTNLKPELVMEAFYNYLGVTWNPYAFQMHRMEIYADMGIEDHRKLVPLEELSHVI